MGRLPAHHQLPDKGLDFNYHLADGLAACQAIVRRAYLGQAEMLLVEHRLQRTGVHDVAKRREYCTVLFTLVIVQHRDQHEDDGAVIVAVNPASLLASKMVKDAYGVEGSDLGIGADILVRAALSDEFANASGKYFDNDQQRFAKPHSDALDQAKNEKLVAAMTTYGSGDLGAGLYVTSKR